MKSQASFENNKDFESTLDKLADLAKERVKVEEFTTNDRLNLLEMFINNEKTLQSMHEILFPKPNRSSYHNISDKITLTSERLLN